MKTLLSLAPAGAAAWAADPAPNPVGRSLDRGGHGFGQRNQFALEHRTLVYALMNGIVPPASRR